MIVALLQPFLAIFALCAIWFFIRSWRNRQQLSDKDAANRRRLRLIGLAVLVAGLAMARLTYVRALAEPSDAGAIGYDLSGGVVHPIMPGQSKTYERQMETMGGKSALFAADIQGLLHGKNLAYLLATLSLAGSLLCFFFAELPPARDGK